MALKILLDSVRFSRSLFFSIMKRIPVIIMFMVILLSVTQKTAIATEEKALWKMLGTGKYIVLMRHAVAPGTGDPPEFEMGDCSTQRNLSKKGRDQAKKIGERFRSDGIHSALVFSSQWCRCLETAKLLNLGPVKELPVLNSFFRDYEREIPQTRMLREWLSSRGKGLLRVLVTHQVNITALTDIFRRSGEMVVITLSGKKDVTVVGTIETD